MFQLHPFPVKRDGSRRHYWMQRQSNTPGPQKQGDEENEQDLMGIVGGDERGPGFFAEGSGVGGSSIVWIVSGWRKH
jgi:hypothetical protein